MARNSARNSLASHAMSASAQDGGSDNRRISVKDGASSCACPGVSTKIDQPPGGITHTDDLGTQATSRATERLATAGDTANELQT